MAVTQFQCGILRRLALQRRERGESYVAGGVALNTLDFAVGERPDAAALGVRWHEALAEAGCIIASLPAREAGKCVIARDGHLLREKAAALPRLLETGDIRFHEGRIGGAWPFILGQTGADRE